MRRAKACPFSNSISSTNSSDAFSRPYTWGHAIGNASRDTDTRSGHASSCCHLGANACAYCAASNAAAYGCSNTSTNSGAYPGSPYPCAYCCAHVGAGATNSGNPNSFASGCPTSHLSHPTSQRAFPSVVGPCHLHSHLFPGYQGPH